MKERVARAFASLLYRGPVRGVLRPRLGRFRQYSPRPLQIPSWYQNSPPEATATISIVTPNLNQGAWLEATIRSVTQHNYPGLEYIIQDGGSTDDSLAIIRRYQGLLAGFDSSPDRGQAHALNKGFRMSKGSIMAYLNSDDILLPGALNYVADFFSKHPQVDVVYGHRVQIDENGMEIGRWILPPHDDTAMRWCDFLPQETLFWRRQIWEQVGGKLDERFHFALDWDLVLRFIDAGARLVRLPRFLGAFRIHGSQKTSSVLGDVGAREIASIRERIHGRPVAEEEAWWQARGYLLKHLWFHHLYTVGLLRH